MHVLSPLLCFSVSDVFCDVTLFIKNYQNFACLTYRGLIKVGLMRFKKKKKKEPTRLNVCTDMNFRHKIRNKSSKKKP